MKKEIKNDKRQISAVDRSALLHRLETRFRQFPGRHRHIEWGDVKARLENENTKLWTLNEMERTGGEPDVVSHDEKTGEFVFFDCSPETPAGRRNLCYDDAALAARKENKPAGSAVRMATDMGIELLTEEQYRLLQALGDFDMKTSSWLKTPEAIRALGGAIFGDKRYDHAFIYHNGAGSYYAARGFRGALKI